MACGGCGGGGNRHATGGESLKKFAYLTPSQLRYLKDKEKQESPPGEGPSEGGGG